MQQGERKRSLEIARDLLSRKMPLTDIQALTDLSKEDLQQLYSFIGQGLGHYMGQ